MGRRNSLGRMAARRRSATRKPATGKALTAYHAPSAGQVVIKPGTVLNDIYSHEDMLPTLLAAAGAPNVKEELLQRHAGRRQDLQGASRRLQRHRRARREISSPRHEFFYFNDDGSLVGLRYDQWKIVFVEQRAIGLGVWEEPFTPLRFPKFFNVRSDPFETADHESMDYPRWRVEHAFVMVPAQQYVGQFLATFKEFPPSQKPGSFSIDQAMEALQYGPKAAN